MALVFVGAVLGAVGNRTYRVWVGLRVEFKGAAISSRCRDLEEGYGFCRGGVGCGFGAVGKGSLSHSLGNLLSPSLFTRLIVRLIAPTVYGLGCECLPSI